MDPVAPVELTDADLLLRPFRDTDAEAVFAACQDPEIQRWTTVPVPYTRADAAAFVGANAARWASGNPTFACVDAANGRLLGALDLQDLAAEQGPMVGFWVAADARRKGVAVRAVRRLARWAFDDVKLPRIRWAAYVGNVASMRVAERAGFVIEGTGRRALEQRGIRRDGWLASMLPADLDRATDPAPSFLTGWPTEPVELRTERLLLRVSRESDADVLLAYARDPVAGLWDPEDTPDTDAAMERARRRADWSSGDFASWVIADPDDTQVYGGIQMFDVSSKSLHATVGYGLVSEARGHGYATEALTSVAEWAFTQTSLVRLTLMHAVENKGSCGVARKAGFAIEGTTRQSYRFGDGELHDEHLHARLRGDPLP